MRFYKTCIWGTYNIYDNRNKETCHNLLELVPMIDYYAGISLLLMDQVKLDLNNIQDIKKLIATSQDLEMVKNTFVQIREISITWNWV